MSDNPDLLEGSDDASEATKPDAATLQFLGDIGGYAEKEARPALFTKPPTQEEKRDIVREWLAKALVIIFGLECAGIALLALFSQALGIDVSVIKDIATSLLTPTVALTGAATGFYYGTSSTSQSR